MIKYYSHLGGWVTSLANLGFSTWLIVSWIQEQDDDGKKKKKKVLYPNYNYWNNRYASDNGTAQGKLAWASIIIVTEIISWSCYYAWRKGAYRYAEHLTELGIDY